MNIIVIGISHKTAPVEVRGRYAFTKREIIESLARFKSLYNFFGSVILATCNRTEIYAHLKDGNLGAVKLKDFLYKWGVRNKSGITKFEDNFAIPIGLKIQEDQIYVFEDKNAAGHLFEVASGLDSQVLGETQILGQVKSAWEIAREVDATSSLIDEIFKEAIKVGKRVRLETKISEGNISIASAALNLLEDNFGNLQDKSVLIIGAGKMSALLTRYFKEKKIKGIFVSNRTYSKAVELAAFCDGEAINFSKLDAMLKTVDIVISSTSSPHIVLKKDKLISVMASRKRPLFILDLAIPRDVDPDAKGILGISLYNLDDLKFVIDKNYNKRRKEALAAKKIVIRSLDKFLNSIWLLPENENEVSVIQ